MNKYELLVILSAGIEDTAKENLVAKISDMIAINGGTVENVDKWGNRKLAYPINYKNEGYYVLFTLTAPATLPAVVSAQLNITENVVRKMFTVKE